MLLPRLQADSACEAGLFILSHPKYAKFNLSLRDVIIETKISNRSANETMVALNGPAFKQRLIKLSEELKSWNLKDLVSAFDHRLNIEKKENGYIRGIETEIDVNARSLIFGIGNRTNDNKGSEKPWSNALRNLVSSGMFYFALKQNFAGPLPFKNTENFDSHLFNVESFLIQREIINRLNSDPSEARRQLNIAEPNDPILFNYSIKILMDLVNI